METQIAAHAGRTFAIAVGPVRTTLAIEPTGMLGAPAPDARAPDLTLRVSPFDVPAFLADPSRWTEFKQRYAEELDSKKIGTAALLGAAKRGRVTLLFGARDPEHNNAVALYAYLTRRAA